MAKSYFHCAGCGESVLTVGRNRSEADRQAAWHEEQEHLCEDCQASRRAEEGAAAVARSAEAGLPALTGSDKQIAWAAQLREQALALLADALPLVQHRLERSDEAATDAELAALRQRYVDRPHELALVADHARALFLAVDWREPGAAARLHALVQVIRAQTSAHWWIDHRSGDYAAMARGLAAQMREALQPAPAMPAAEQVAAEAEALLLPPGTPASTQVADLRHVGNTLQVRFAEKLEPFRLLMRASGFTWAETHWSRQLGVTTGDATDRLAQLAHQLLSAGFRVRLHDEQARARALAASFTPEQTRWITIVTTGQYEGWFSLAWRREDDFYAPARRLLGSRYVKPRVLVPVGSAEEVAEFAAKYGFSLSPGASAAIARHRAALAGGAVVANPIAGAAPVTADDARPALAPEPGEIDAALRDD